MAKTARVTRKGPSAFPIVSVGASGGSVEAFIELLRSIPINAGMAYIVQHVDAKLTSAVLHILSRATKMPVLLVEDNMTVHPNHVYILPAKVEATVVRGVIKTSLLQKSSGPRERSLLSETRQYAEDVVNTVRQPLVILDEDLRVRSANESFYRTFHVFPEETEGRYMYDLGTEQWNIPTLLLLLRKIIPNNSYFYDFEVEQLFPHIGYRTMLLNAHRLGGFKMILLALQDITERKELERRKDEFINIASHELKTPITTIKGYTQLLARALEKGGEKDHRIYLGKMDAQVNRLTRLINEMLDVSKIQASKLQLKKVRFSIDDLVKDTVEDMRHATKDHKIVVQGKAEKIVTADKYRVNQVLVNLIANAVKFSRKKRKIIVRAAATRDFVVVSVEDFGAGISKEDLPKLFERFYQVETRARSNSEGLGLGLYISSEIVKNHGGDIRVVSEKGKGSTFTFTLPLKKHG